MSKHYIAVAYDKEEEGWISSSLYDDKDVFDSDLQEELAQVEQDTIRIIELDLPEVNFKKDFPVVSIKVA